MARSSCLDYLLYNKVNFLPLGSLLNRKYEECLHMYSTVRWHKSFSIFYVYFLIILPYWKQNKEIWPIYEVPPGFSCSNTNSTLDSFGTCWECDNGNWLRLCLAGHGDIQSY